MTTSSDLLRVRDDPWSIGAVALSVVFSTVFIIRSAFELAGEVAFTLVDDAMISMTYARNLAEGHGLLWNPGESAVEGITNPVWTFVLAIVHLVVPGDRFPSLVVMLIGAGLLVACVVGVRRITQRLAPDAPTAATAAAWATALLYPLVFWTLRGMETGLVVVLMLALVERTLRVDDAGEVERADLLWLSGLAFAAIWTRIDLAIVTGAITLWALLATRGAVRRGIVGAVVIGTAGGGFSQLAARLAYYGEILPNTWTLKVAGTSAGVRLERGAVAVLRQVQTGLGPAVAAAIGAIGTTGVRRRRLLLPVTILGATAAYTAQTGADAWEWMGYADRFVLPGMVMGIPIVVVVAHDLLARTDRRLVLATASGLAVVALTWLLPVDVVLLQYPTGGLPEGSLMPRALAVAGAFALAGLVAFASMKRQIRPAITSATAALAVVLAAGVPGIGWWVVHNAVDVDTDAQMANHGRYIAAILDDQAHFATVFAGAPKYFSDRPAIDLLGKNDAVIAASDPQDVVFHPGHTKWNYDHSILLLRPDAVARLWRFAAPFLPRMYDAGYAEVVPADPDLESLWHAGGSQRVWVLRHSPHVRWDLLAER